MYDITNDDSFIDLEEWMKVVHQVYKEECIMPHLALVSNKGKNIFKLYSSVMEYIYYYSNGY